LVFNLNISRTGNLPLPDIVEPLPHNANYSTNHKHRFALM